MATELPPHSVSDLIPLSIASYKHLNQVYNGQTHSSTFGKIAPGGAYSWLANGCVLEIISTVTGERQSVWRFGEQLKGRSFTITCVSHLQSGFAPQLLVGLDCGNRTGLVALFDIKSSSLLKAIEIPEKVTALEIISSTGGVRPQNKLFSEVLWYFHGILAVGTEGGRVYLIDLALDNGNISNEEYPDQLMPVNMQTLDLPRKREEAFSQDLHLALLLNSDSFHRGSFILKSSTQGALEKIHIGKVSVTSLKFICPIGALAVGFNFGAFQLWRLHALNLEHASLCENQMLAVSEFAFQEPENDPRNYCYLWAVQEPCLHSAEQESRAFASLYSLSFTGKQWISGIGYHYENLTSCTRRFEYEFGCNPLQSSVDDACYCHVITCSSIHQNVNTPQLQGENSLVSEEGGLSSTDTGLCAFVWEAVPSTVSRPKYTLGIFDLNQWYQFQMPYHLRSDRLDVCPYFGFFALDTVVDKSSVDMLLNLHLDSRSICGFRLNSLEESQYYPSALSFKVTALTDGGVINASFLGLQRKVLADMRALGPPLLVEPKDAFNMCHLASLLSAQSKQNLGSLSVNLQREAVLSVALEYDAVDFIVACITQWATGEFATSGCSLRFLQEWAWKKAFHIKTVLDRVCTSLFDCSGIVPDKQTIRSIRQYSMQLRHLASIHQLLLDQAVQSTDQGVKELEAKLNVISLLTTYFEVILYLLCSELLPELSDGENIVGAGLSYPASSLSSYYSSRRHELRQLNSAVRETEVLLIDGILSHFEKPVAGLWEKDGGDGLYPPPNLHALLSLYLLDEVPLIDKHFIMHYALLDLSALLHEEHHCFRVQQILKFPAAFSLSPSLTKLIEGFWCLDHKAFDGAINALLDPAISITDMKQWQHSWIIKAFLFQNESKNALKYANIRKPCLQSPEDVRLMLTVLLANEHVSEAFFYQRMNRDHHNIGELLNHFFLGCQQTKKLGVLMQLPLSPLEEEAFIQFLQTSTDPHLREVLVMYLLQRCRYSEALKLNAKLTSSFMNDMDPAARERASVRNLIVDGFCKALPHIQRTLAAKLPLRLTSDRQWTEVIRPRPLSAYVASSNMKVTTQSALLSAVTEKIQEMWSCQPNECTPFRQKGSAVIDVSCSLPFVCTPITPKISKLSSQPRSVTYPAIVNKIDEAVASNQLDYFGSAQKSRFFDVSPFKSRDSAKRRMSRYYSAEALSLLQTPPVRRRVPILANSSGLNSVPEMAPQSILKVRRLLHSPLTPSHSVQSTSADGASATTPTSFSTACSMHEPDNEDEEEPISSSKQLRFSSPKDLVDRVDEMEFSVRTNSRLPFSNIKALSISESLKQFRSSQMVQSVPQSLQLKESLLRKEASPLASSHMTSTCDQQQASTSSSSLEGHTAYPWKTSVSLPDTVPESSFVRRHISEASRVASHILKSTYTESKMPEFSQTESRTPKMLNVETECNVEPIDFISSHEVMDVEVEEFAKVDEVHSTPLAPTPDIELSFSMAASSASDVSIKRVSPTLELSSTLEGRVSDCKTSESEVSEKTLQCSTPQEHYKTLSSTPQTISTKSSPATPNIILSSDLSPLERQVEASPMISPRKQQRGKTKKLQSSPVTDISSFSPIRVPEAISTVDEISAISNPKHTPMANICSLSLIPIPDVINISDEASIVSKPRVTKTVKHHDTESESQVESESSFGMESTEFEETSEGGSESHLSSVSKMSLSPTTHTVRRSARIKGHSQVEVNVEHGDDSKVSKPTSSTRKNLTGKEFHFSKPTEIHAQVELPTPADGTRSFIFSPPLTRSRTRRMRKGNGMEVSMDVSALSEHMLESMPELSSSYATNSGINTAEVSTRAVKQPSNIRPKTRRSTALDTSSASPINFISPMTIVDADVTHASGITLRTSQSSRGGSRKRRKSLYQSRRSARLW